MVRVGTCWSMGTALVAVGCLVLSSNAESAHPELANRFASVEDLAWFDRPPGSIGSSSMEYRSVCYLFDAAANAGISNATVQIVVDVRADGTPGLITVANDPGFGLVKAAVSCAKEKKYTSARDAEGRVVSGHV